MAMYALCSHIRFHRKFFLRFKVNIIQFALFVCCTSFSTRSAYNVSEEFLIMLLGDWGRMLSNDRRLLTWPQEKRE